jgi:hypothetical protein
VLDARSRAAVLRRVWVRRSDPGEDHGRQRPASVSARRSDRRDRGRPAARTGDRATTR